MGNETVAYIHDKIVFSFIEGNLALQLTKKVIILREISQAQKTNIA